MKLGKQRAHSSPLRIGEREKKAPKCGDFRGAELPEEHRWGAGGQGGPGRGPKFIKVE